jgi:hypothetical protein
MAVLHDIGLKLIPDAKVTALQISHHVSMETDIVARNVMHGIKSPSFLRTLPSISMESPAWERVPL